MNNREGQSDVTEGYLNLDQVKNEAEANIVTDCSYETPEVDRYDFINSWM